MGELGNFVAQRLIEKNLSGRVVNVVVPPDDMGDSHLGIVYDDAKLYVG